MILLPQAAQQAVEALNRCRIALDDIYNHNEAACAAVVMHYGVRHDDLIAATEELESALQQQPEPVAAERFAPLNAHSNGYMQALASLVNLPSREFEGAADQEWIDREDAMRLVPALRDHGSALASLLRKELLHVPALQQQEVPREPVAWYCQHVLTPSMGIVEGWLTFDKDEEPGLKTAPGTSFVVRTPLYAFPSTTQQQEAGSEWKLMPVQATLDMSIAFAEVFYSKRRCIDDDNIADWWGAMLAAAPSTPEKAEGGREADPALLAKAVMTPEEENTVRRGCCPKCMERTLGEPVEGGGIRYRQCTRCASIYAVGVQACTRGVKGADRG